MKATITVDLSDLMLNEESLGEALREEITRELRNAVKQCIKKDKRFSELVKETAISFFESVKVVRK